MKRKHIKLWISLLLPISLLTGCASADEGPIYYYPGYEWHYSVIVDAEYVPLFAWQTEDGWDTTFVFNRSSSGRYTPELIWYLQEHENCPAYIMKEILRMRPTDSNGDQLRVTVSIIDCPALYDAWTGGPVTYSEEDYPKMHKELRKILGLN